MQEQEKAICSRKIRTKQLTKKLEKKAKSHREMCIPIQTLNFFFSSFLKLQFTQNTNTCSQEISRKCVEIEVYLKNGGQERKPFSRHWVCAEYLPII